MNYIIIAANAGTSQINTATKSISILAGVSQVYTNYSFIPQTYLGHHHIPNSHVILHFEHNDERWNRAIL